MLKSLLITLAMFAAPPALAAEQREEMPAMSQSADPDATKTQPPTSAANPMVAAEYDPFADIGKPTASTDIVGAEDGYQYTYAPLRDYVRSPGAFDEWRDDKARRGYLPRNGPRYQGEPTREHHGTITQVEIWRRPLETYEQEHLADVARCVLTRRWAEHYFRHPSGLPDIVRDAMYAFHGLAFFPDKPERPTEEQLKRLVRREVKIHTGDRRPSWD